MDDGYKSTVLLLVSSHCLPPCADYLHCTVLVLGAWLLCKFCMCSSIVGHVFFVLLYPIVSYASDSHLQANSSSRTTYAVTSDRPNQESANIVASCSQEPIYLSILKQAASRFLRLWPGAEPFFPRDPRTSFKLMVILAGDLVVHTHPPLILTVLEYLSTFGSSIPFFFLLS